MTRLWSFIVHTGRAVMHPVYQRTYERHLGSDAPGLASFRDMWIQQAKDLSRSIDYLETRHDIEDGKFAYWGISESAVKWPIFAAVEKRLAAGVMMGGVVSGPWAPPEIDNVNFAPRATAPILMLNGRYDFLFTPEWIQWSFDMLGAPEEDKRLVLFESGHVPTRREHYVKETLGWLDRCLGPVRKQPDT